MLITRFHSIGLSMAATAKKILESVICCVIGLQCLVFKMECLLAHGRIGKFLLKLLKHKNPLRNQAQLKAIMPLHMGGLWVKLYAELMEGIPVNISWKKLQNLLELILKLGLIKVILKDVQI